MFSTQWQKTQSLNAKGRVDVACRATTAALPLGIQIYGRRPELDTVAVTGYSLLRPKAGFSRQTWWG